MREHYTHQESGSIKRQRLLGQACPTPLALLLLSWHLEDLVRWMYLHRPNNGLHADRRSTGTVFQSEPKVAADLLSLFFFVKEWLPIRSKLVTACTDSPHYLFYHPEHEGHDASTRADGRGSDIHDANDAWTDPLSGGTNHTMPTVLYTAPMWSDVPP